MKNSLPETSPFFARDLSMHPPAYTPWYKTSVLRSPTRALISLEGTRSEITGPVFGHNMLNELDNDLILNYARPGEMPVGPRILVHGRVLDEGNRPVPGALLEFWQANAGGRYRHKKETYLAPSIRISAVWAEPSPMKTAITGSRPSSPALIRGQMASMTGARRISIFPSSATALHSASLRRCISRATRSSGAAPS